MDLSSRHIPPIIDWAISSNVKVEEITERLVWKLYHEDIGVRHRLHHSLSRNNFLWYLSNALESGRRHLMRAMYRINGDCATGVKCGYVYAIKNPAFPGFLKIGSSVDPNSRLETYQTYSPLRDYELVGYFFSPNRRKAEQEVIGQYESLNEWCRVDEKEILRLFKLKNNETAVKLPENIYENSKIKYFIDELSSIEYHCTDQVLFDLLNKIYELVLIKTNNTRIYREIFLAKSRWKRRIFKAYTLYTHNRFNFTAEVRLSGVKPRVILRYHGCSELECNSIPDILTTDNVKTVELK